MKISTGAASRLRTLHEGRKAHLLQHNNPAPCPHRGFSWSTKDRGWEFFTQHVQIVFSEGCDHTSYVSPPVFRLLLGMGSVRVVGAALPTSCPTAKLGRWAWCRSMSAARFTAVIRVHWRPFAVSTAWIRLPRRGAKPVANSIANGR